MNADVRVGCVLLLETGGDSREVRDGALERHAGLEPRDGVEPERAAALLVGVIDGEGNPDVRVAGRECETRREDADDRSLASVEPDGAADGVAVGREEARPEAVAQDHHAVAAWHVLLGGESATNRGRDAEHVEEVRRREECGHALWLAVGFPTPARDVVAARG